MNTVSSATPTTSQALKQDKQNAKNNLSIVFYLPRSGKVNGTISKGYCTIDLNLAKPLSKLVSKPVSITVSKPGSKPVSKSVFNL